MRAVVAASGRPYGGHPVSLVTSSRSRRAALCAALLVLAVGLTAGCTPGIRSYAPERQAVVDRSGVEFPTGLELRVAAVGFTAATALATDDAAFVYVADHGERGKEARITRIDPATGEQVEVYPARRAIVSWFDRRPRLYGPVGGLSFRNGELYASVRDADDSGTVVAFDLSNWPGEKLARPPLRTVTGELPAAGDHGVTALAFHPVTGRLFFGVGSATNSGVVGLDNWQTGWLQEHPDFHDQPLVDLKINGFRFDTEDPASGLLNPDKVNTAPFNAFGESSQRVPAAPGGKPTAAIYSVDPRGGDLRVEAHGIRNPAGLAFNEFANLYASNQGMEMRGTRPVKDDPDTVVRVFTVSSSDAAVWYGWPDYSADFRPITDPSFQPPSQLLVRTGYAELSFLIDHAASGGTGRSTGLAAPDRGTLLAAVFPALSGASGIAFVPFDAPGFERFAGELLVALRGDRAPFATSGLPLRQPQGRRVGIVDPDRSTHKPFLYNTRAINVEDEDQEGVLTRPVAVTFDRSGALWILDQGIMRMRDGRERYKPGTGRLYRLAPPSPQEDEEAMTRPTQDQTASGESP